LIVSIGKGGFAKSATQKQQHCYIAGRRRPCRRRTGPARAMGTATRRFCHFRLPFEQASSVEIATSLRPHWGCRPQRLGRPPRRVGALIRRTCVANPGEPCPRGGTSQFGQQPNPGLHLQASSRSTGWAGGTHPCHRRTIRGWGGCALSAGLVHRYRKTGTGKKPATVRGLDFRMDLQTRVAGCPSDGPPKPGKVAG